MGKFKTENSNCMFVFLFFPHSKVKIALVQDHLLGVQNLCTIRSLSLSCDRIFLLLIFDLIWTFFPLLISYAKHEGYKKSKDTSTFLLFDCLIFDLLHTFIKLNNAEGEKMSSYKVGIIW